MLFPLDARKFAKVIQLYGFPDAKRALEVGSQAGFTQAARIATD
jgi:hypothetical protein